MGYDLSNKVRTCLRKKERVEGNKGQKEEKREGAKQGRESEPIEVLIVHGQEGSLSRHLSPQLT